jgi:uncharacterized membrane protein
VVCITDSAPNMWIWIDGANVVNQTGVYGTEGTASPTNIPGARDSAASWTDSAGNLWLFGGEDRNADLFNDLWEYSSGEWTWISGSSSLNQLGVYGVQGTANAANTPGGRIDAATWVDTAGNLWLFGGKGMATGTTVGNFNDLWKFSSGQWTWVGGPNVANQSGVYGTKGQASSSNIPGARQHAFTWVDKSGNFWLFGGAGYDVQGDYSVLNDLWECSNGIWTWVSGPNVINTNGTYGTMGQARTANVPGARSAGASWIDASGNLWLFGGGGLGATGTTLGYLNDLWEFSNGEWTWMGGPDSTNQSPVYGTEGTANAINIPGGRIQSVGWTDTTGNFWLFGGLGLDSDSFSNQLNDLWEYSGGEWTWVGGSNVGGQAGNYGTQGVPAATNIPGARQGAAGWLDLFGNFWIFGGNGYDSTGTSNDLNDLWVYQPSVAASRDGRLSRGASGR